MSADRLNVNSGPPADVGRGTQRSEELFARAKELMPGGVNSPVRSFRGVGGSPLFIARGAGSHLWDVDGHEYIDYIGSWGPLILGHSHPEVIAAIKRTAEDGTSFGAPSPLEVELAELVIDLVPGVEMVRMVNSGTEATMSALRLARACTGRNKIVKFIGCYHGHADSLLIKAGSGAATLGIPDSPGVPATVAATTIAVPFNDVAALEAAFKANGGDIAGVILEPVVGNMGVVPPRPGYLEAVREITRDYGALLIFDEVMTGFRVALHCAQSLYGIDPDLTCLGKVIGGGLPVGAYGGKRKFMEMVAPAGPMYQAGTLSGNPLAMAAGLVTLRKLKEPGVFEGLAARTDELVDLLRQTLRRLNLKYQVNQVGAMFTLFFTDRPVWNWDDAATCDAKRYAAFFHAMLKRGVHLVPSQFEACFMSAAHTAADVEATARAAQEALKEVCG
ncbi:MAG: glutamate-1-semialdehyde 2,1-aminomutase [Bacillota bacterium]